MTIALNATGDGLEAGRPGISHSRRGAKEDRTTLLLLTTQLVVLIYLQKISFPVSPIWAPMVFCFLMLLPSLNSGALRVNPARFFLYMLFAAATVISQAFAYVTATTSMLLVLVLNSIPTLEWRMRSASYMILCDRFSKLMIVPCICVFFQYAYQIAFGAGHSLSLDPFLPQQFVTQGFISESSTETWVTWNRPNGLFFLEPSYCSAYLATAIILDLYVLQRPLRAGLFAIGLLAANGGTGLLMLVVAFLITGLRRYTVVTMLICAATGAALVILGAASIDLPLLSRVSELTDSETSGYGRLLAPLLGLVDLTLQPHFFATGEGAGQITAAYGSAWPLTKLVYEYGAVSALIYFMLVLTWINWRTNFPLAVALFIVYQFTGGYLVNPFLIILIYCLCGGELIDRELVAHNPLDL